MEGQADMIYFSLLLFMHVVVQRAKKKIAKSTSLSFVQNKQVQLAGCEAWSVWSVP
jgi:hypothetical protein